MISSLLQQQDTIVYGVEVPGVEGRAGMAAIVEPTDGLDLNSFLSAIQKQLPSYARPLFLRLVARLDITGTFKMKKIAMQKEGFNPNYIKVLILQYSISITSLCFFNNLKILRRLLNWSRLSNYFAKTWARGAGEGGGKVDTPLNPLVISYCDVPPTTSVSNQL